MAYSTGKTTFITTGSQTVNTNLSGTPTWCRVTCAHPSASEICVGTCDGTRQNFQSTNNTSSNTKIMVLKNGSGTVVQDVTWSSFGMSGGLGTVTFNVTTNGSIPFTLEVGN